MARIFDIKHFAVHDGPGIRTTLFLKGCPLKCVWCHNPESISPKFQLGFLKDKCVNCHACENVCDAGVHSFKKGYHTLNKELCVYCGKCEKACHAGALTLYGREVEVSDVLPELLEDRDFYGENGGVTLSGGEALIQGDFCAELLCELKKLGIHTAVDTCGFVKKETLDKVIPFTDLFLYDIKAIDEDVHKRCTGVSNKIILENLKYLDSLGKKIEVRIPFVPEYNDGEIEKIGQFLSNRKNVIGVRILPYHNYARSKYHSLDMPDTSPEILPESSEIEKAKRIISSFGLKAL